MKAKGAVERHPGRSGEAVESRDRAQNKASFPDDDPGSALRSGRDDGQYPSPAWSAAIAAVTLLAIDPKSLGGLRLGGSAGPARDRLLAIYKSLLAADAPVRKMPVGVADSRLLGGLELTATLAAGRPILQRGLLAETDGGALVIPGAERLSAGVAGRLAMALDQGSVSIERDGFAVSLPARFAIVACDEALFDEDPPPAILTERLALTVDLAGVARADLVALAPDAAEVSAARARLGGVAIDYPGVEAISQAALSLGVFGLRPLIFACAAARASAALGNRETVDESDLALAARLVLGPRATCLPAPDEETEAQDERPEPQQGEDDAEKNGSDDRDDASDADPREMAERILEAAAAAIPPDILAAVAGGPAVRTPSRAPGKAGAALASKRRGRPIGARAGDPGGGARLDLLETLRAAAPWQRLRKQAAVAARLDASNPTATPTSPSPLVGEGRGEGASQDEVRSSTPGAPSSDRRLTPPATFSRRRSRMFPTSATQSETTREHPSCLGRRKEGSRILVRREDFRIQRLKERRRTITIFVVDASGSAALHRLAEAKGAVELMLAQAYVRRDEVALIAFRGQGAELLLPPTRSLARARRSLAGLPGGGGTPLASGIDAAALMVDAARRRGDTPVVVFLTDGAANVARDGTGGRARAQEEATSAARGLKAYGCSTIVVDVSPRPQVRAKELADAMGSRYVALPSADAATVARAIGAA